MSEQQIKQFLMPHLVVSDARKTMEFYRRAFGAEELHTSADPTSGKVMHATMRIGDSAFLLNDEYPEMGAKSPLTIGGTPVTLNLNFDSVEKIDAAWKRAVDAGAKVAMPLENQFWGGRYGIVEDVSGHRWAFHAQVENPSEEEIAKRAAQAMKK
jgi:PhnB protein